MTPENNAQTLPDNPAAPPAVKPPVKTVAGDLTADLIDAMPTPTAGSGDATPPANAQPEISKPPAPVGEIKDGKGQIFDAAIHARNDDGTPKKNSSGNFYSKFIGRGGAKRRESAGGEQSATPQPEIKFEGAPRKIEAEAITDEAQGIALMIIPTVDGVVRALFSEGMALTSDEKKILTPVTAAYLRAKNAKDIPPGLALALVAGAIYAPKLQHPTVKERLTLILIKVKGFFSRKTNKS